MSGDIFVLPDSEKLYLPFTEWAACTVDDNSLNPEFRKPKLPNFDFSDYDFDDAYAPTKRVHYSISKNSIFSRCLSAVINEIQDVIVEAGHTHVTPFLMK